MPVYRPTALHLQCSANRREDPIPACELRRAVKKILEQKVQTRDEGLRRIPWRDATGRREQVLRLRSSVKRVHAPEQLR